MIRAVIRCASVVTIAVCTALLELTDPRTHGDDPLGQALREPFEGYTMHGDETTAEPCARAAK